MRRRRKVNGTDLKPKAMFNDHYEERKALEYLNNLISSPLRTSKVKGLIDFSLDALGHDVVTKAFVKKYPQLLENIEVKAGNGQISNPDPFQVADQRMIAMFLEKNVTEMLERRLDKLSKRRETEFQKRLFILQKTFGLSDEEREIITIYYLSGNGGVCGYLRSDNVLDLANLATLSCWGHIPLGMTKGAMFKTLNSKRLFDLGIFGFELYEPLRQIALKPWCVLYLSCLGAQKLSSEFYANENDAVLDIGTLDIPANEQDVLDTLMRSEGGFNLLFHGSPGTGKSTLAKCLAKEYGQKLYTVNIPKSNDSDERISGIWATLNAAGAKEAVVLIDEADDLLNTRRMFFGIELKDENCGKSWINTLLESHKCKVIWITNHVDGIDPSTMRRFSFSMEFKSLNERKRFKIIKAELEKKGFSDYFTDDNLRDICREYHATAAGIIDAIKILSLDKKADRETALRKVKTVLKNHELVVFGDNAASRVSRNLKSYTLDGLNCSEDPTEVVSTLRRYAEHQERDKTGQGGAASLLLYGMPGTGKSEFVYYLGQTLGKEVLLKRCSDIQSMWVGETEKNIATAFRQAQEDGSLLFFDEADSFLFPRKDASHSWEKNFTNEILTQLESFNGILAFATNDMDGLDHASLRRFRFKIEFRPLTHAGILHFYTTLLRPLVDGDGPSSEELMVLSRIANLTPGDFTVVRDRYGFAGGRAESHRQLIEALMNEVRYKKGTRGIGF